MAPRISFAPAFFSFLKIKFINFDLGVFVFIFIFYFYLFIFFRRRRRQGCGGCREADLGDGAATAADRGAPVLHVPAPSGPEDAGCAEERVHQQHFLCLGRPEQLQHLQLLQVRGKKRKKKNRCIKKKQQLFLANRQEN
jgi:hypothetical protein